MTDWVNYRIRNNAIIIQMIFNVKQAIIDCLRATKRDNIEIVIDYMEKYGFFARSCHTHHHYPSGLADHAWQTYQIAERLDAERCASNPTEQKMNKDSIAIAALLHDFYGCSGLWHIRHKDHGMRSARMLKELGFKLNLEEFLAIRFHMKSRWSRDHFLYNDALTSPLAQLVYKSDRKSASLRRGSEI